MHLDQFSNPIFNNSDIFDALYKGQKLSPELFVETSDDIQKLEEQTGFKFAEPYPEDLEISLEDYDAVCQQNWKMPDEYKTMDIETFLIQNSNKEHYERLIEELNEFKARNMLDLLRWLKYFVDTCKEKNIVSGVGRGSSVASYVLYIIGVHKIDPIKYNLDWREFLR